MTDSPTRIGTGGSGKETARWARHPESLWRAAGDTVVVLPAAGEDPTPFCISGSAAQMWKRLAEPISVAELAAELAEEYEADAAVIAADLVPVLHDLLAAGAVERSP